MKTFLKNATIAGVLFSLAGSALAFDGADHHHKEADHHKKYEKHKKHHGDFGEYDAIQHFHTMDKDDNGTVTKKEYKSYWTMKKKKYGHEDDYAAFEAKFKHLYKDGYTKHEDKHKK